MLARAIQTATKGGVASQGSIGRGMSSPAYTAAISKISKAAAAEMPPAVQTYQRCSWLRDSGGEGVSGMVSSLPGRIGRDAR